MPGFAVLGTAWWAPLLFFLIATHLSIAATTIYLHRAVTHGGVQLSPLASVPMRLWLWLSTGIVTAEWVACHRKHHAFADREGDPHSPALVGLTAILVGAWAFYRRTVREPGVIEQWGRGCPDDWLERRIFSRWSWVGLVLMAVVEIYLFGAVWGPVVWLAQVASTPFVGGIVNGLGHAWGYRNYECKDRSRNFFPAGLLIGGEELHNNHHADPRSARFRRRWFEVDVGWIYIKILSWCRLARVLHAAR